MRCNQLAILWSCLLLTLAGASPVQGAETIADRRRRLKEMSAAEKRQLLEKKNRYDRLGIDKQEQLKQLHRDISSHPDKERLQQVMDRYYRWLATLEPQDRVELQQLTSAADKINKIKELKRKQEAKALEELLTNLGGSKLSPQDLQAIQKWLGTYLKNHQSELLSALPADRRGNLERFQDPDHRRRMLLFIAFSMRRSGKSMPSPSQEELQQLTKELSPATRKKLQQLSRPEDQVELIHRWLRAAMFARWTPHVSDEQLLKFMETLSSEKRAELEKMSRDQMLAKLRHYYFAEKFRRDQNRPGFFRPPHGGPSRGPFPPRGRKPRFGEERREGGEGRRPGNGRRPGDRRRPDSDFPPRTPSPADESQ